MTKRIVSDSNVIVAAIRSKLGWSHKLVFASGIDHRWQAQISSPLLQEYTEQVFAHSRCAGWDSTACNDFLDYLCSAARWRDIHFLWRPLLPDEDDHMVLEVAMAGSAQFIVTFNKNDLKMASEFGIDLVTPKEFLLGLQP